MLPKTILSLQHPFVKFLVRLREDKALRLEEKKVLLTGKKMIQELLDSRYPFETFLVQEGYEEGPFPAPLVTVSADILKKITGLQAPEPLAAVAAMPEAANLDKAQRLLVLDGIQDPGNLGTLLRTALAFGWDGAYITQDSCDPFNPKALRAAKGATFRLPLQLGSWEQFVASSTERQVLVADMEGEAVARRTTPCALVLSHETQGADRRSEHFRRISIPIDARMESLNVASAGAILLYELRP